MIKGFTQLLAFQGAGLMLQLGLDLPIPGAVLGMLLMLAYCLIWGPGQALQDTSQTLLGLLPLFILPASAGVIDYGPLMREAWFPLSAALLLSALLSFWITPLIFRGFVRLFRMHS